MLKDTTIERLRWHAGLVQKVGGEDVPSIASSTAPRSRAKSRLQHAVADCLEALNALNHELNGEVPSAAVARDQYLPRNLVYAITEIVRMIRECQQQASEQADATELACAAWRIEVAWSGVLAGDIDDIAKHVEQEEDARF